MPETSLRLVWQLECRLPPPEVNAVLRTGDGWLLGMTDLVDPESGLVAEYDGAIVADRWPLEAELVAAGARWGVDAEADLAYGPR